jgi:hypothetical protein
MGRPPRVFDDSLVDYALDRVDVFPDDSAYLAYLDAIACAQG